MGKLKTNQIEFLKWIAIFSMVLDHVGKVLLEGNEFMSAVGRIAFPLFAFLIAHNFLFYSRNKLDYFKRIMIFAIISQPIYVMTMDCSPLKLNILFTLGFAIGFLLLYEELFQKEKKDKSSYLTMCAAAIILLILGLFVEYMFFGIFTVVSFYFLLKNKGKIYYIITAVLIFLSNLGSPISGIIALLSLPIIYYAKFFRINLKRTNKWFFYLFYPGHLAIIYLIKFFS